MNEVVIEYDPNMDYIKCNNEIKLKVVSKMTLVNICLKQISKTRGPFKENHPYNDSKCYIKCIRCNRDVLVDYCVWKKSIGFFLPFCE